MCKVLVAVNQAGSFDSYDRILDASLARSPNHFDASPWAMLP